MMKDRRTDIIQLSDPVDFKQADSLIQESEYSPYQYLAGIKNTDLKGYVLFKLGEFTKDDSTKSFAVHENGIMCGLATLKPLPWDEQIFKLKMATVPLLLTQGNYDEKKGSAIKLIGQIMDECQAISLEHLSVRIDSRDMAAVHALEESGFKLMDILVYLLSDLKNFAPGQIEAHFTLRESREEDIEDVVDIARVGFHDYTDRFHIDPQLDQQYCDDLYAEWARNSCRGNADKVFVAEKDDKIIGFTTAKLHRDAAEYANLRLGEIEFGSVHPEFQGLGVFSSLMKHSMNWLKRRADMTLAKTLINNFDVQRTCQKLGFKLTQTQCTFHKSFA